MNAPPAPPLSVFPLPEAPFFLSQVSSPQLVLPFESRLASTAAGVMPPDADVQSIVSSGAPFDSGSQSATQGVVT